MNEVFWAVAQHILAKLGDPAYRMISDIPAERMSAMVAAIPQQEIIRKENGLAIININGMMMRSPDFFSRLFYGATDTNEIEAAVNAAASDSSIEKILLVVNSPGGSVSGTAELGDAVAAANQVKPVTAYISDIGCSAAYWVASQAGKVYSNASALVGSIGVRMLMHDYSAMYAKEGIRAIPVDTGKFKSAGTPGTEVTADHVQMWQDVVNEHFDRFASAVKAGRGMSDKKFAAVSDAQVLSASKAKEAGLIDGISTMQDVVASMMKKKPAGRSTASGRARLALIGEC
jgi:signal peptide peptidase SppA